MGTEYVHSNLMESATATLRPPPIVARRYPKRGTGVERTEGERRGEERGGEGREEMRGER